ncbi:MAG: hypothetical protein R3223_06175 [Longimicrobiales bacterium]|nr:hypothetical protein [Longimicrobiales bacterium]
MRSTAIAGLTPAWAQLGSNIQIPFDPATDFVYVLLAITLFVIWYGNRQTKKMRSEDQEKGEGSSPGDSAGGEG